MKEVTLEDFKNFDALPRLQQADLRRRDMDRTLRGLGFDILEIECTQETKEQLEFHCGCQIEIGQIISIRPHHRGSFKESCRYCAE